MSEVTKVRCALIQERLTKQFAPSHLEVIDDSAKHHGHAGSAGGAGHYTVIIAADFFKPLSKVAAHRAIYDVFDDLIPREIHALQIKIVDISLANDL